MNGAVQPVMATPDGTLIVGPARVAVPNLPATNGVVHIIGSVLSPDASTNSSGVAIAERMGDFGPFNRTKVRYCAGLLQFLLALTASNVSYTML